jgi:hypothetical protein
VDAHRQRSELVDRGAAGEPIRELFWIVKHGIKMTRISARSDHNDEELWATAAFLEKLPGMSEPEYAGCDGRHGAWRTSLFIR